MFPHIEICEIPSDRGPKVVSRGTFGECWFTVDCAGSLLEGHEPSYQEGLHIAHVIRWVHSARIR